LDSAGFVLCLAGAALLVRRRPLSRQGALAAALLGWTMLHALANTLEWTGLAPALDRYENHLQVISPVFWGSILYILLLQSEMDRRKETESRLEESEERLALAVEGAGLGLWDWRIDTDELFINTQWAAMLGYGIEELTPAGLRTWKELCHPGDLALARDSLDRHFKDETAPYACEIRLRHKDGRWVWVMASGKVFQRDATGAPLRMSGMHIDIDALKRAQVALAASEDKFSTLFQLSPDAIALADMDGVALLLDANRAFARLCGVELDAVLGRGLRDLEMFRGSGVLDALDEARAGDAPLVNREVALDCGGDEPTPCSLSCQPLHLGERPCMLLVLRDVSEAKRMQRVMVQTEKMLSVGGIAAGIAHEINNPLGIILQAAQNLSRRCNPASPGNRKVADPMGLDLELVARYMDERGLTSFVENIRSAAERAAKITRNMLDFSRPGESRRGPADVRAIIENALDLAGKDFDLRKKYDFKSIAIDVDIAPSVGRIECVQSELEQVMLNLLRNAAQAMASAEPPIEAPRIRISATTVPGDRLRLVVEDNGPGVPPHVVNRVFEPFFSTKPPGEGTGLGLSVSYFIITQGHGGTFDIQSPPGRGARLTIELPPAPFEPAEGLL
jgi:PAS domain S-box-containing protein